MKLTRCDQMHYYDADIYERCPYCSGSTRYSPGIGNDIQVSAVDRAADRQTNIPADDMQTELLSGNIVSKG